MRERERGKGREREREIEKERIFHFPKISHRLLADQITNMLIIKYMPFL